MAHAGGARPSVEMAIKEGELWIGKAAQRVGVVSDVDLAVQRLLNGETIFCQQYGSLVTQVQRTVEQVLKKPGVVEAQDADELERHWPDLAQVPDGIDRFSHYPVTGTPEGVDVPPKSV